MAGFKVSVISRYTIKPSAPSSTLRLLPPYKLSILDQLTPYTHVPTIFFYHITEPNFNLPQTLTHLRDSLSETLTLYYPLSGRTKNNMYVDDFDAGVPYVEAQVNCSMLDFLKLQQTELLNDFLPFPPFRDEMDSELLPLGAFQVNLFEGGIALGLTLSHKVVDGVAANAIFNSWAAIFRGCREDIIYPNLSQSSLAFPPRENLPERYVDIIQKLWFEEKSSKNYVTRRFLFDAKAISTLQVEAKSEDVLKPSRLEALTGFLWKHQMTASPVSSLSGSLPPKLSIAVHAVSMRPRISPKTLLDNTLGNMFWFVPALLDIPQETAKENITHELCYLVNLLRESVNEFSSDYVETLKGEEGYQGICELVTLYDEGTSIEPTPEIYAFTSWTRFFNQLDFGWGKPFDIGVMGKVGPGFRNLTVFLQTQCAGEIEAWVTLDEKHMTKLENDSKFLAFATPKP